MPDGLVNLTPTAGDIVIMREMPTGCLHGVMPWTSTTRQRRTLTMRFKSGQEWLSHCNDPSHARRPTQLDPRIRTHLGLPQTAILQPETVALLSGDSAALVSLVQSALDTWERPPAAALETRTPLWRAGQNLSCTMPAAAVAGAALPAMTAEMRFLLDSCGFLHLRSVLSPAEVAAASEAYDEAVAEGGNGNSVIGRPALEQLITHPRLLPIYQEFAGAQIPPPLLACVLAFPLPCLLFPYLACLLVCLACDCASNWRYYNA